MEDGQALKRRAMGRVWLGVAVLLVAGALLAGALFGHLMHATPPLPLVILTGALLLGALVWWIYICVTFPKRVREAAGASRRD